MKSTMKNMVLSLTIIASAMGGLLAWVHELTKKPIAEASTRTKNEALASVLPAYDNDLSSTSHEVTVAGDTRPVTLYDATLEGTPVGTAVESWTMDGFSGEITVIVGFDNDGVVTGYRVLQHAETPGLGAKANEWFRDSIGSRSILGTTQPLTLSKEGGLIDGITAATITSRAFLGAINRAREAINQQNN